MPYQELYNLLVDDKILAAKKLFMDILQKEFLWKNSGIRCSMDEKKNIQDLSFSLLWGKIKNNKIQDNNALAGVIVNTLREADREYQKERLTNYIHIEEELYEKYDGYLQGINPFRREDEKDPLHILLKKEKMQKVDNCLLVLSPFCRTLIQYKYEEEMSHYEIIQTDIGIKSVELSRVELSKCINNLRECVFKELEIKD